MQSTTIIAQATPAGRGGIAVVRVSGPLVQEIARQVLGLLPKPRLAKHSAFLDAEGEAIDDGIALFFPQPNSFTGEDVLELQGHGGPAVVDILIKRILSLGACLARPGEFSERAFLNNKMDLAQAEAVADLIDAASAEAARSAVRSLQGEFSKKIHRLVEALIQLRIYVEAAIDFADEEIDFLADLELKRNLQAAIQELLEIQISAKQGTLLRDGISVVIIGEPNVGKSSLLNCLSGKDIAIVTDIPGTTRDLLREYIQIDGMPIHIIDTAGLRESTDKIEQEGIRRAHEEIKRADLILFVVEDISAIPAVFNFEIPVIIIHNKIDLIAATPAIQIKQNQTIVSLSAKTGQGMDLLKKQIKACVGFNETATGIFSARQRHLDALLRAKKHLMTGLAQLEQARAGELLAEDLRQAQLALNEITGEFTADDLLGRIFSSFCIGK